MLARARTLLPVALLPVALLALACDGGEEDDHGDDHGETEVISRVTLTFTPAGGGDPVVASFDDPDGDGGVSGTSDPIVLALDTAYTLDIEFLNALEDPAEDITEEIREEAEEHLVLVYGSGVAGPASTGADKLVSHSYDDVESDYGSNAEGDDLPVGLRHTITADEVGTAELTVMLRHLPELNGQPQKVPGLAEEFADGGALPGDVDALVTFDLSVE